MQEQTNTFTAKMEPMSNVFVEMASGGEYTGEYIVIDSRHETPNRKDDNMTSTTKDDRMATIRTNKRAKDGSKVKISLTLKWLKYGDVDRRHSGLRGAYTVVGVKNTTAFKPKDLIAEETVNELIAMGVCVSH